MTSSFSKVASMRPLGRKGLVDAQARTYRQKRQAQRPFADHVENLNPHHGHLGSCSNCHVLNRR